MWYAIVAAISSLATAVFMVKFIKHNPKKFGVIFEKFGVGLSQFRVLLAERVGISFGLFILLCY
jgi:hypothetical protein